MFVEDTVALFHNLVSCILNKRWCIPDSKAAAEIGNLITLPFKMICFPPKGTIAENADTECEASRVKNLIKDCR